MGMGDWLMAAGEARKVHAANKLPVLVIGRRGVPMWSEVFDHNPYILRSPTQRCNRIVSGGGVRPYISLKTPRKWFWKAYKPIPAELFFTKEEKAFAEPYRGMVMIEPNVKNVGHTNKAWPYGRWVDLVDQIGFNEAPFNVRLVQCVSGPSPDLGVVVRQIHTPTFRLALAVQSVCKAFVGTDGGLMHGAAASGIPAVILWSEFTSPGVVGYGSMVNLRHAGNPCGMRVNCPGCAAAMNKITVAEVVAALKGILK
jgi:ADP-heptose:LPS heptosyltransferase